MKIYTGNGIELAHKAFTFPDGQPHFKLETEDDLDTRGEVTIETAIRNPQELFEVLLARDVLGNLGYSVSLDVRYLLGARMDRAIDHYQPFTLQVVARLINGAGFRKVRILDAHSEVAMRLIRNCTNILPHAAFQQVVTAVEPELLVVPDKGARPRVEALWNKLRVTPAMIAAEKHRDMETGKLSNPTVAFCHRIPGEDCLIADDICDGGGTFVQLAALLRTHKARSVSLFVTHGIFSKGLPLEGIDRVFTTDSYTDKSRVAQLWKQSSALTVIPVSMKDMK